MALFSAETIEKWLADFRALGHRVPAGLSMLERDLDAAGQLDAGLVVIGFRIATTETYLERPAHEKPQWLVHFGPREGEIAMTTAEVAELADELNLIAQIAAYLEARTAEALARLRAEAG